MNLQAVIFDVDGTLAETERFGHRIAYNRAFTDVGADWQWNEQIYSDLLRVEGGSERLSHYLEAHEPGVPADEDQQSFIDRTHARKNEHYQQMVRSGDIPSRHGVHRLIGEIREAGLALGIASSSKRTNVLALLRHTLSEDAVSWFDTIVTGDDVHRKKPASEVYDRVLAHIGLPPTACIAIEDSENGCEAAVAAGLPTIVTTSSFTTHQRFHGAMLVADSLGDPGHPWHVRTGPETALRAEYLDMRLLRSLHSEALDKAS